MPFRNNKRDPEHELQELNRRFKSVGSSLDRRAKLKRFAKTFKSFLGGLLIVAVFLGVWWWMLFGHHGR